MEDRRQIVAASVLSAPYEDAPNSRSGFVPPHDTTRLMADSAITSAPYSGDVKHDRTFAERDARADEKKDLTNACGRGSFRGSPTYGETPGQIGRLKDPPAASVLSAPYENSITDAKPGIDMSKSKRLASGRKDEGANSQVIIGGYQRNAAVLSAPYAAAENRRAAGKVQEGEVSDAITRAYDATNHGQTAGNIANLPDACVTSAPYGNQQGGGGKSEQSVQDGKLPASLGAAHRDHREKQRSPGQIANLPDKDAAAVTSAPFEDSLASDDPEKRAGFLKSDPKRRNDPGLTATYGDAAGVTSAPWEATAPRGGPACSTGNLNQGVTARHSAGRGDYADNQQGQIGVLQAENYADACGKVYASLAKAGIRFVCSVTKDPVRNKKLRPLRLLTISLFEQAGYRLVAWRRAWLYHTQAELDAMAGQESLFGDEVEESKRLVGRLSFFRRLSLSKGGIASPFEDVLFFELVAPAEQPEPQKPEKSVWVQPELPETA